MNDVPRLRFHVARLGVVALLLVGCSSVTEAGNSPVLDVECDADVQVDPRGEGRRLRESNVPVEQSAGTWSIGAGEGDILIDMDAPSVEASWYFIIERSNC